MTEAPKLLHDGNKNALINSKNLVNADEFIANVRRHDDIFLPQWRLLVFGVQIVILLGVLYFFVQANSITNPFAIIISIILIAMILMLVNYMKIVYSWRAGISGTQIIDNILSQGKVSEGNVDSVDGNRITFSYKQGSEIMTHTFVTSSTHDLMAGDTIKVLVIHRLFAGIL